MWRSHHLQGNFFRDSENPAGSKDYGVITRPADGLPEEGGLGKIETLAITDA